MQLKWGARPPRAQPTTPPSSASVDAGAHQAVDSLHEMAGANGIYDHTPLQRVFRDQRAAAGHFSFSTDAQLPPWGLVALGGEFKSPTL